MYYSKPTILTKYHFPCRIPHLIMHPTLLHVVPYMYGWTLPHSHAWKLPLRHLSPTHQTDTPTYAHIRLQLQPGQSKLVNFPVLPLINDGVIEITIVGESNVNSMRTVKRVKVKVSSPSWVYNTYSWSDYKVKRRGILGLNRVY